MRIIKICGMLEELDQMKSELTVLFTNESKALSELDESFLLNKIGDVYGEDIRRSTERLFRDKNNLREYAQLKKTAVNGIIPKVTEIVNKYKMAFRNSSEMTDYLEIIKRILTSEFKDVFGMNDDSFEKNRGYGKILFNDYDFSNSGGPNLKLELEEAIYDLVELFEDTLDENREMSQRKNLVKNYIGKTVYLGVVQHNGKPYFNRSGILKSLNGDRALVDVDIDGEIVNVNIRAELLRFSRL